MADASAIVAVFASDRLRRMGCCIKENIENIDLKLLQSAARFEF